MADGKQRVTRVVSWHGKETSRFTERMAVHEEAGRRYVIVGGLRYRLNQFNEYEMAYGNKSTQTYGE